MYEYKNKKIKKIEGLTLIIIEDLTCGLFILLKNNNNYIKNKIII